MSAAKPLPEQLAAVAQPMATPRPKPDHSPYSNSIILFDGQMHTVVPIGSVLNLPQRLRDRVIAAPQGDFTFWPDFLKRNQAWLAAKEVPLEMARGDAKAAAAILKDLAGDPRLLISVFRNCPITILEPPRHQAAAP
jgi:hypothetical protein